MPIDPAVLAIFGYRKGKPNIADGSSSTSVGIARSLFDQLAVTRVSNEPGQTLGSMLEVAIGQMLQDELPAWDSDRQFLIGSQAITQFSQYEHLERLARVIAEADPHGVIRSELGTDYLIKPDVTVGLRTPGGAPFLHAAVSCKWTIRSDRVQNIRHEGVVLTRHRRGRQPHVVTVTAEPLPSRLAAIARGTGEVDCVYHVALTELHKAATAQGVASESDVLEEIIGQDRIRPLSSLPEVLALY